MANLLDDGDNGSIYLVFRPVHRCFIRVSALFLLHCVMMNAHILYGTYYLT